MAVRQSLSKNNFWGLVEQKGPWKETRTDVERSRTGGIRHPGHGDWKIMVNPYQQDGSKPKQTLSKTLQRKVNTSPLKFSLGPTTGRGMTKTKGGGRLTRPGGMKPTDIEVGGHPGPGLGGSGRSLPPDGGMPPDVKDEITKAEGDDGAALGDNNQPIYEHDANAQYRNVTQGVNMPGVGFTGDINLGSDESTAINPSPRMAFDDVVDEIDRLQTRATSRLGQPEFSAADDERIENQIAIVSKILSQMNPEERAALPPIDWHVDSDDDIDLTETISMLERRRVGPMPQEDDLATSGSVVTNRRASSRSGSRSDS